MRARVLAVVAAISLVAGVGLFAPASHAAGTDPATVTAVSWWTVATGVPKAAGGMQVAQDATGGEMSVGAVKIKVNVAKLASVLFVLNEAASSLRSDGSGMMACLTKTTDWAAGNPGLWTDLPARDCTRTIQMVRSATQQAWSANLAPLLNGKSGTVGVMFIPGAPPPPSLPIPTLENLPVALPSLPLPVVGGVPIPPPAVTALLPPLPKSIAFPVQIGYTVDISSVQIAALADTGLGGLSPVGGTELPGSISTPTGDTGFGGGTLTAAPPLVSSANTQAGNAEVATPIQAVPVSHAPGKPWGRLWALFPLAVLIGVAGSVIRKIRLANF